MTEFIQLSDANYRLMVDASTDYAIFYLDPDGMVRSWNAGAQAIKGYESHEVLGRHFSMFYPQELLDKDWPAHELTEAREHGRFEDEGWRLRKDGSSFWANVIITRLVDASGVFQGFSKITRDLSKNKHQEDLLRTSEEQLRLMVEGVQDYAIYMLDTCGYIASWNAGAQNNKGYTSTEIIGQHFSIFYPQEVVASGWPSEKLRRALADGRFGEESWRLRKDGSRFWANVVITALHDATGIHRGFTKVTSNMTDRKRVHLLEDEGNRISTFLAMLGHELRNPLAPIANALALLDRSPMENNSIRKTHDLIGRQVKQLTRLVDDLLDVGRISSGKVQLVLKMIELSDVIDEAVEASQSMLRDKSHTLSKFVREKVWVSGDRARLVQVVCNILNNAAKFTPSGGQIKISLQRSRQMAELVVQDNGQGISDEDLPRIFDLFSQGDQDMARTMGGLGLGLSLVQQLVTLHGGEVCAYSRGIPGAGTEMVIHLPCVLPIEDVKKEITGPLRRANDKSILVVDDNRDAADTLGMLVESMGYDVTVAYDGLKAIELVNQKNFSTLLLDLGLPGLSGLQVAQRLAATMKQPPHLIAVTGYDQEEDRNLTFKNGFYAHLSKPLNIEQLEDVLNRLTVLQENDFSVAS